MKTDSIAKRRSDCTWMTVDSCKLDDFVKLIARETSLSDYPLASAVQSNVLVYEGEAVRKAASDPDHRKALMAEWAEAIYSGPGILVFKNAFPDKTVLDAATAQFNAMIKEQHEAHTGGGDHFAKPGANDRVWNSLGKHCLKDPASFAVYYGNAMLALISEAWLGPHYQVTAQLNVVNPGGAAQSPHRDYHLGFLTAADVERNPLLVQLFSPLLTLQGAIALGGTCRDASLSAPTGLHQMPRPVVIDGSVFNRRVTPDWQRNCTTISNSVSPVQPFGKG